ncbi:hypothetical protein [Neisseria sicca]|jgi:hypothetical protein|uniref:hypothetical protein n=1 Tax=Neisseria sicca TaxID=490 RepID=UPI000D314BC0|nr:hypothetical protein [Neisseria sicca]MBF1284970.1 hypothetical protein [Neisseria sp.]
MLVNFVWDEGQNILILVGEAHAAVEVRVLFKSIIQGRLKTRVAGLPSRNPCFQTTSVMSGRSSVGFAREKRIGLFCFWAMDKIS